MLEGKKVNLKVTERRDNVHILKCFNDVEFKGKYFTPDQWSYERVEREWERQWKDTEPYGFLDYQGFVVKKKDGAPIGWSYYSLLLHPNNPGENVTYMSCNIEPKEQRKGYGTEVFQIMVDYLFLQKPIMRIQVLIPSENKAAHRVLEKTGFKREGTIRKSMYINGKVIDDHVYGIIRDDWKEPKILPKTTSF